jgi:hypothetical protein
LPRRSKPDAEPETIRRSLVELLTNFASELTNSDLRAKVIALVPAFHKLRDLGSSLIPKSDASNTFNRITAYLLRYHGQVIAGDELMVVAGISEWARRVRQLRVEFGWAICTGVTFQHMAEDAEDAGDEAGLRNLRELLGMDPAAIRPDQYVLIRPEQDRLASHRWNVVNQVRRRKTSVSEKIIEYFRLNVGELITSEELKYLAKDKKEWARRVRELRTEHGWPISTRNSGREDLPIGVYVLEQDRQAYEHDRTIPDTVRIAVLRRDDNRCTECGWGRSMLSPDDPRKALELHHLQHHKDGGENTVDNLITLCNVHHDDRHRSNRPKPQQTARHPA